MRIAVFSDIHGNCVAFDNVLSDIERQSVDGMVCLGDAIQGGVEFRKVPFDAKEWIRVTVASGKPHADRVSREYSART